MTGGRGLTLVAVDPGSRNTGVITRRGDELLRYTTLVRKGDSDLPDAEYLREVVSTVLDMWSRVLAQVVAVEAVQKPSPFHGKTGNVSFTNVTGLLGTAMVVGAVLAAFPHTVEVPPGGNGSGHLGAYPIELRPTRGKGAGSDNLRHMRSAWDVAGTAALLLRQVVSP